MSGRPVTVAGKAHVRLLPTPVLSFTDVVVGDAEAPDVKMERFRAEVELAPLLKGEVRIIQMAMERPVFHVDLADYGRRSRRVRRHVPPRSRADLAGAAGDRRRERARLRQPHGSKLASGEDRRDGRGRYADGAGEGRDQFRARRGAVRGDNRLRPHHRRRIGRRQGRHPLAELPGHAFHRRDVPFRRRRSAEIRGKRHGRRSGAGGRGRAALAVGRFPRERRLRACRRPRSASNSMQVSYGATERPLILEASGKLDFADEPRFDISLAARQIDVDRTLGDGGGQPGHRRGGGIGPRRQAAAAARCRRSPACCTSMRRASSSAAASSRASAPYLKTAEGGWLVDDFAATLPGETQRRG